MEQGLGLALPRIMPSRVRRTPCVRVSACFRDNFKLLHQLCARRADSAHLCECEDTVRVSVCVCVSCLRFVPLVYAHYVSAARCKLTICCTRNDAGGATKAHKHTHRDKHASLTHTKELFLAFSNLIFRLTARTVKVSLLVVIPGVYALFHCPFHLICSARGTSRVEHTVCIWPIGMINLYDIK